MGDLFRQSGSLTPGQTNVDAADFHALVDGLVLTKGVIINRPFISSGAGQSANFLIYDPLTDSLRRATISTLLESAVGINASSITSGQLAAARLTDNSIPLSKLADFTIEALRDAGALTGVLSPDRIPNTSLGIEKLNPITVESLRDAAQLTGTLAVARIADGTLELVKLSAAALASLRDAANLTNASNLVAADYFESGEEAIPAQAATLSVAHGLSGVPRLVQVELICKTAQWGYAVGDRILSTGNWHANVGGFQISMNDTDLMFTRWSNISVVRRDAVNGVAVMTYDNWRLIFKAWR